MIIRIKVSDFFSINLKFEFHLT